tara:strand:+ start:1950 stop:3134 length:1185 start_codon:yes stop_codon:yes gene_type:complete
MYEWPLINDNISEDDKDKLVEFIRTPGARFTQHENVRKFEEEWSTWLGSDHTTYVNSGASANWIMASILKEVTGPGEVILSPFGWVSDVVPFLVHGFKPVFVDVDMHNMSSSTDAIIDAITEDTKAVLMVHILGFNGLTEKLMNTLDEKGIMLIEDCCESHGATFNGRKIGTFGAMSNFSFYFGHHMTTIEGGTVCTNDPQIHDLARMFRSHGMTREASDVTQDHYKKNYPDLNPLFTFAVPGFNVRSHELCAVMGRNQLKRLDSNIEKRCENFATWLDALDENIFITDFSTEGSSNFALPLILKDKDKSAFERVQSLLKKESVEFRKGTAGGGNQYRQPYLERFKGNYRVSGNLNTLDHIHDYGLYVGNHTDLTNHQIKNICHLLNNAAGDKS